MEKFNLTKRVFELVAGDIFYFSGGWRYVKTVDEKFVSYVAWSERDEHKGGNIETLNRGSQMKIAIFEKH